MPQGWRPTENWLYRSFFCFNREATVSVSPGERHKSIKKEKYKNEKSQRFLQGRNFLTNQKLVEDTKKKWCPVILSTKKPFLFLSIRYVVTFPKTKHLYHHTGIAAGVTEPLDPRVSDLIKKLIRSGCRRVKELESREGCRFCDRRFIWRCFKTRSVRFFPGRRKITNLITYINIENTLSKIDRENVESFVLTCQHAKIRFTPR